MRARGGSCPKTACTVRAAGASSRGICRSVRTASPGQAGADPPPLSGPRRSPEPGRPFVNRESEHPGAISKSRRNNGMNEEGGTKWIRNCGRDWEWH